MPSSLIDTPQALDAAIAASRQVNAAPRAAATAKTGHFSQLTCVNKFKMTEQVRHDSRELIQSLRPHNTASRIQATLKDYAMKQILGMVLAALIVISVAPYARSLGSSSPPPGVSANDWIPCGDAAGFVIAHDKSVPTLINPPDGTVKGYFMVRRKDSWLRVDSAPDYGVKKATMQR